MTLDELISFSTLRGDNVSHHQFMNHGKGTPFWNVRIEGAGRVFHFQYHKDGESGEMTFTKGRMTIKDDDLGWGNTELHGWKHLEKELV